MEKIIIYIEGAKDVSANKILYYTDGTIEVRDPQWQLLETVQTDNIITILDIENRFNVIFPHFTPKEKEIRILLNLGKISPKQANARLKRIRKSIQAVPEFTYHNRLAYEYEPEIS